MKLHRRSFLALPIAAKVASSVAASQRPETPISFSVAERDLLAPLRAEDYSTVGLYDIDWLLTPQFGQMLDLIASSPGAIDGIRFFGIFTAGAPERLMPESGGDVWTDPDQEPDFTVPFAALEEITTRGLKPFISLGFFPPAVSPTPITPPGDFSTWRHLVLAFLDALTRDARFGPDEIASWRFEVWNEPNEGRFWSGTFEQYLELYRVTADAFRESGLGLTIGGPAMAYKPESEAEDGPTTMAEFLGFLKSSPELPCHFISYHRKGTVDRTPPDPLRLWNAAAEIEQLVLDTLPERAASLELINNEADEKIGFESPYLPRMDAFAASWLTTLVSVHNARNELARSRGGPRFSAYQDNINLQLMEAPFDGRRSIFVPSSPDSNADLFKTAGAVWYDLLPIIQGQTARLVSGARWLFPASDLHVVTTRNKLSIAVLATYFPTSEITTGTTAMQSITLDGIPWDTINVVRYQIDRHHSNSYAAAGGASFDHDSVSGSANLSDIESAQELTFSDDPIVALAIDHGHLQLNLDLEPFATSCFWITPFDPAPIGAPDRIEVTQRPGSNHLKWTPNEHQQLLGYEVARRNRDGTRTRLTNRPVRPTSVRDVEPPGGQTYQVRAVTCSGISSEWNVAPDPD